jgi:DNA-binding SARP family transcriptional activator
MTRQALAKFPADSPRRLAAQINLGTLRFDRAGELDLRIESAREALALAQALTPEHVSGIHLDLGRLYALLGQRDRMLHHLAQAADASRSRPWVNLHAEVLLKVEQGEFDAAAAPLARLRAWDNAEAIDGALSGWAWALIDRGLASDALALLQGAEGFLARTARALARASCHERVSVDELPPVAEAVEREPLLYLAAARWRIGRDLRDLDRLLVLTSAGARVLPGLVPLSELPREQPQLARAYPLKEVLASGWKEVIAARSAELPPLRITLFGAFRIERGGELLELAPRLQTIVTLLGLGHSRDEVAAALWPELGAQAARNNLHVNLNKLRRTLEPWGVPTYLGEQGLLRTGSDLAELRAALRAEDAGAVLLLYRGDLAPGVDLEDVNAEREQVRRQVTQLLLRAARAADAPQAEALLARVLELDPLDEAALQQMLRLWVASGRRARAVQAYERFRQMLGEQIGARPLPATRAALDSLDEQTGDG